MLRASLLAFPKVSCSQGERHLEHNYATQKTGLAAGERANVRGGPCGMHAGLFYRCTATCNTMWHSLWMTWLFYIYICTNNFHCALVGFLYFLTTSSLPDFGITGNAIASWRPEERPLASTNMMWKVKNETELLVKRGASVGQRNDDLTSWIVN